MQPTLFDTPQWRYVRPGETPPPGTYMVAHSSTGASGTFVLRRRMTEPRHWAPEYVRHRGSTVTKYAYRDLTPAEQAEYKRQYWGEYVRPEPPPLPHHEATWQL